MTVHRTITARLQRRRRTVRAKFDGHPRWGRRREALDRWLRGKPIKNPAEKQEKEKA